MPDDFSEAVEHNADRDAAFAGHMRERVTENAREVTLAAAIFAAVIPPGSALLLDVPSVGALYVSRPVGAAQARLVPAEAKPPGPKLFVPG